MTQQMAWSYNEKELSFSLRSKIWTCADIAKLLGEDTKCPKEISFECAVHETKGLSCTIFCTCETDFKQMKSELLRVLS